MNKIHSINNPVIINGTDMEKSDFGIVRKLLPQHEMETNTGIKIGQSVFKITNHLICLENGYQSDNPSWYEVEIKDNLTLQRIK